MVHLTSIPTDSSLLPSISDGSSKGPSTSHPIKDLSDKLTNLAVDTKDRTAEGGDEMFMTSVYASRYAAQDLPKHEMPEREMPKEVAYRMIKDETSLDGNPMLK